MQVAKLLLMVIKKYLLKYTHTIISLNTLMNSLHHLPFYFYWNYHIKLSDKCISLMKQVIMYIVIWIKNYLKMNMQAIV